MTDIRTLQLVTTRRSFFDKQVEALEERGVDCVVRTVPQAADGGRSPREFAEFYVDVLGDVAIEEFDLVHANYGLVAPFALAQPTRPVVLSLWGSDVMGPSWLVALSKLSAAAADAVVVPSTPAADALGRPHDLVPFGVDTDLFRPIPRERARAAVGWDPDERVVLFPYDPGRDVKNYPLAERVAEAAATDVTLRVLSDVDYERVPLYMNASDAVLVTSRRESGPMVVKEATACNVPVVSTDVGFARDVLAGVSGAHVCDDETALVEALDAVLEGNGRIDGRDRVDDLSLDRAGDRLVSVYRRVLDRR